MKEIMSKPVRFVVLALSLSCFGSLAHAGAGRPAQETPAVHAQFDMGTPAGGPFPTDWFTVKDTSHNTRRRVNLPMPDCAVRRSDCEDLNVINTLDGFNPIEADHAATVIATAVTAILRNRMLVGPISGLDKGRTNQKTKNWLPGLDSN